ncbi:MAG TPA: thioredoxin domain-containing protein [Pseudonocardiaceae bacterium]
MGGAERAERKRKWQAAQAVKAAPMVTDADRGSKRRTATVLIAVLLALVVGVGMWLHRGAAGDLPATIPVAAAGPAAETTVHGDSVQVGKADAPVIIDVYEDFLCSGCGQFEQLFGHQLSEAAAAGQARVVYHPVAILDDYSHPAGYSTLAASAALCAAESGVFPRFHDSLYATQPRGGGGPGWTSAQLQQLAGGLGAGDHFGHCVQDGGQRVADATDHARQHLGGLRPNGQFGTPTILVNGAIANVNKAGWLDEALGAAR